MDKKNKIYAILNTETEGDPGDSAYGAEVNITLYSSKADAMKRFDETWEKAKENYIDESPDEIKKAMDAGRIKKDKDSWSIEYNGEGSSVKLIEINLDKLAAKGRVDFSHFTANGHLYGLFWL